MPVPATNDEFLDLVRKSGVIDESKLKAYLDKLKIDAVPVPEQPHKFAVRLVRDGILTVFQAEQILQGKYKRFTIGKYKVLEKIGVGGMGQVFLCEHKMMKRRVALKVLPPAQSGDEAARERFYREARAVAALDHPNIVRAYDVDQDDNLHFLVMEFVDGTNLHDLVKKHGVLDVTRACHYIYAAAAGLQYASGMGIVHRDIKPGNLLVDRAGIVKILDMGLARFFQDDDESLTRKHDENVLGTADYLSPEQAIDSHKVDVRADIYSLGGTFYYLLTGSAPFPEGNIASKLAQHQHREPKAIELLRPEVPEAVVAIVERMMKKRAEDRYQSPAELMAALSPFVQTPIPPPTDAEMPKLSRAAIGGAIAASAIGRAPPSGVLLAGTSSSGGLQVPTIASGGPTSGIIDEAGVWANIDSDPGLTAPETTPKSAKTIDRKSATAPDSDAPKDPRRRLALILGLVGVAIIGGSFVAYKVFGGKKPRPASSGADNPGGPRTLYVTRGASQSPDVTFPTLAAALKSANPGDKILLVDDPHEEPPVTIAPGAKGKLKDVVIEPGNPARFTRIKLPEQAMNVTKRGLIEIAGADGLTLRNLTFDAGDRADYGITVSGAVEGLVIDNCTIRKARSACIRFDRTVALPDRPAKLDRLYLQVDGPNNDAVQIAGTASAVASNIEITNSRFSGPGWNALHVLGPVQDVSFVNNRVYKFTNGLLLADPPGSWQLRLANNTFHSLTAGVHMMVPPPADAKPRLTLEQNYFAKTRGILSGLLVKDKTYTLPGLVAMDNVRDKDTKPGNTNVDPKAAEVANYTLYPPEKDDDAAFLRIDDASPLKAFGPKKLKIGAQ